MYRNVHFGGLAPVIAFTISYAEPKVGKSWCQHADPRKNSDLVLLERQEPVVLEVFWEVLLGRVLEG